MKVDFVTIGEEIWLFLKKFQKFKAHKRSFFSLVIETKNKPKIWINRNLDTFFYLDDRMYPIMWMEEKM